LKAPRDKRSFFPFHSLSLEFILFVLTLVLEKNGEYDHEDGKLLDSERNTIEIGIHRQSGVGSKPRA